MGSVIGGFTALGHKCNKLGSCFPGRLEHGYTFLSIEFYLWRWDHCSPKSGNEETSNLPQVILGSFSKLKVTEWERNLPKRPGECHQPTTTEKFKASHTLKKMLNHRADVLLFTPKSFTWKAKAVNSWSLHYVRVTPTERRW